MNKNLEVSNELYREAYALTKKTHWETVARQEQEESFQKKHCCVTVVILKEKMRQSEKKW